MTVPSAPVCVAATRKQSPNAATTNRVGTEATSASNVAAGTGKPAGVEAADLNEEEGDAAAAAAAAPGIDAVTIASGPFSDLVGKEEGTRARALPVWRSERRLGFFSVFFFLSLDFTLLRLSHSRGAHSLARSRLLALSLLSLLLLPVMLSRHLRRTAASALARAESSSSSSFSLLLGGESNSSSSSLLAAVRAISSSASASASASFSSSFLPSSDALSVRSTSGHDASCSYGTRIEQGGRASGALRRGFAADAAAAIYESDHDEEDEKSNAAAVKELPDVPAGSR